MFINDKCPRATTADGELKSQDDWELRALDVERGAIDRLGRGDPRRRADRRGRARRRRSGRHARRAGGRVAFGNPAACASSRPAEQPVVGGDQPRATRPLPNDVLAKRSRAAAPRPRARRGFQQGADGCREPCGRHVGAYRVVSPASRSVCGSRWATAAAPSDMYSTTFTNVARRLNWPSRSPGRRTHRPIGRGRQPVAVFDRARATRIGRRAAVACALPRTLPRRPVAGDDNPHARRAGNAAMASTRWSTLSCSPICRRRRSGGRRRAASGGRRGRPAATSRSERPRSRA